jgi:hypothetical protein
MYKLFYFLILLVLVGCGKQSTPRPRTPTQEGQVAATPTIDFDALQATSDAMSAIIQPAIEAVDGVEQVTLVSTLGFDDGTNVNIELVSADDSETFVQELLAVVQQTVPDVLEFRVTIRAVAGGSNGSTWLWEKSSGELTSASF